MKLWRWRSGSREVGKKRLLHCSFCNKSQRDVLKMIAGPEVQICSECVQICTDILAEDTLLDPGGPEEGLVPGPASQRIWCALCRTLVPFDSTVPVPDRGRVCRACIDALRQTVAYPAEVPTP